MNSLENYEISVFVVFVFRWVGDVKINRWLWLNGKVVPETRALSTLSFGSVPSARLPALFK